MNDASANTDTTPLTGHEWDDHADYEFGPLDIVLGLLTAPLLFWALMYAVTGHQAVYATRASRLRLYLLLLAIEIVMAAGVLWWVFR
ncbi:MAG: hypothetical protein ABI200_05290 [Gaiellales bacterium]